MLCLTSFSAYSKRLVFLIIGFTLCFSAWADVHLVVDVSGNIQRFDPQKQRLVAIQSFVHQLPDGIQAGVWTYAGRVNKLVPQNIVNAQWREKAASAVSGLGGYGAYSNVGMALMEATYHWRVNPSSQGRNIILITDSGLRVTDNAHENAVARDQFLKKLVPSIQRNGIKVYVLAFPKADHDLYKTLAMSTGGVYQQLSQPTDLQPALTKLLADVSTSVSTPKSAVIPETAVESTPQSLSEKEVTQNNQQNVEAKAEVKPIPLYDHPPTPEFLAAPPTTATTQTATPLSEVITTTTPPSSDVTTTTTTPSSEDVLGADETEAIRTALADAEEELNELLNEFAAMPKNDTTSGSGLDTSMGQNSTTQNSTSDEPLVITLADGSVLVTSDQQKASEFTNAKAGESADVLKKQDMSGQLPDELPVQKSNDIWPSILTILVVVNVVVIVLLLIGRFFWLRRQRGKL